MNKFLILLSFMFLSMSGFGQEYSLSGHIIDEEKTPLLGATIVLLDAADSTMVAFGITDELGKFLVYEIPEGKMILQVSYTGYSDYRQAYDFVGDTKEMEIEEVVLSVSSAVLEEVSIKAEHIPMGISGDTINYNSAAFKTRPGANVEDLLKKLPGIEVARDGSIKAQGKDVKNVLVDGKEFFSNDATIATKNLEAVAVDKVQVYDKKSEEAEFTGVDDGQEEKTINLKLKDGYKNGGFGKISVDVGNEKTRQAKLNYNRFSPSIQASIIGNANNLNEQAFSLNEYIDFMGGFQNVMASGGLSDFGGGVGGVGGGQQGIKDQKSLGSNFNIDFSKSMQLNANYLFASSSNNLEQSGVTENFIGNESFSTIDTSFSNAKSTNHRFNTKLKYKPNRSNAFTLNTRAYTLGTNDINNSTTEYLVNGLNQNMSTSNTSSLSNSLNINSSLIYKRNFLKKGRNVITNVNYEQMNRDEESDLDNSFVNLSEEALINQLQTFSNNSETFLTSTKYNEPIGRKLYLGLDYKYSKQTQTPTRDYFNRVDNQLILDTDESSLFQSQWSHHTAAMSIKRNRKKLNMTAGLSYKNTKLIAKDNGTQLNEKDKFHFLLPSGSIKYKMKGTRSIEFAYTTRLNAPQLSQMVTQVNNLNPNYLLLGNPNLTPEYVHSFRLNYSSFDQFNFSNQFANISYSFSPNKIVNSRNYRSDLVTEVVPLNASNHTSITAFFSQSSPIRKLKVKYRINSNVTYSKYNTFVNNVKNDVSNGNLNFDFGLENRNKDIVDISGGLKLNISAFSNEFNSNFSEPFVNYSWYMDGFVILGKGFNLGAKYDYRIYNGTGSQEKQVANLVNTFLSKSLMKDKLTLKVTVHDLLNQNIGIGRSGNINTLSNTRFNTLGRYVLVGVSYRIGISRSSGLEFGM